MEIHKKEFPNITKKASHFQAGNIFQQTLIIKERNVEAKTIMPQGTPRITYQIQGMFFSLFSSDF